MQIVIRDWTQVINLDECKSIGTHWIAFHVNGGNVIYFGSFGVEHIPNKIKKFIDNKNIRTNIFTVQVYHSMITFILDLLILC